MTLANKLTTKRKSVHQYVAEHYKTKRIYIKRWHWDHKVNNIFGSSNYVTTHTLQSHNQKSNPTIHNKKHNKHTESQHHHQARKTINKRKNHHNKTSHKVPPQTNHTDTYLIQHTNTITTTHKFIRKTTSLKNDKRSNHKSEFKDCGVDNFHNHFHHEEEHKLCNCNYKERDKPGYIQQLIYHQKHKKHTELELESAKTDVRILIQRSQKQKMKRWNKEHRDEFIPKKTSKLTHTRTP